MTNTPPRSGSFYLAIVVAGLVLALFAQPWGRWNLSQSRERLFALEEQQIQARTSFDRQKAETDRIEAYHSSLTRTLARRTDRTSPQYVVLTAEADRTAKRLENAQLDLERRRALTEMHGRHQALLIKQMETDQRRSDSVTTVGLALTVLGLFLWYVRRQRFLDAQLRETGGSTGGREGNSPAAPG